MPVIMASKTVVIITVMCLSCLSLLLSIEAVAAESYARSPSPFQFLRGLQGVRKGDRVQDIDKLKNYLQRFGYLTYTENEPDDEFDAALESALKTYQHRFNLEETGILDHETVSTMMMPRCGVEDITNTTTGLLRVRVQRPRFFHAVSRYSCFPGNPKWPVDKYHLTYAFPAGTRADGVEAVRSAFKIWACKTRFMFSHIDDTNKSDLKISFESRDHGDGYPFDGPGGVLAHAFRPTDGRFHYDADEIWSKNPKPYAFHLRSIALHEIGHLLGLGHSTIRKAIMYPTFSRGESKGLDADDINGITALYDNDCKGGT